MDLKQTIDKLLVAGKGLLAADESNKTANQRLAAAAIDQTQEMRRQYRQLLFTTPDIASGLSGVILYDETIRQNADQGQPFAELLQSLGIIPGIKTDMGLVDLPNSPGEKVSQGLEGLAGRNQEYRRLGARFAKWRSVIGIGPGLPTAAAIQANATVLARYAKITQESGLVPIVEPEVLLAGDHTFERCGQVLAQTLKQVFEQLQSQGVDLGSTVLKTSMVLPGKDSNQTASPQQVAEATAKVLTDNVPDGLAGVVFLSGGQSPAQATENLNQIAKLGSHPWLATFSYSRALQDPVLKHWVGKAENVAGAQTIFARRVKLAALAQQGKYTPDMEEGPAGEVASLGQD